MSDKPRHWDAYALLNSEGEIQGVRFSEQRDTSATTGLKELGWTEIPVTITETKT